MTRVAAERLQRLGVRSAATAPPRVARGDDGTGAAPCVSINVNVNVRVFVRVTAANDHDDAQDQALAAEIIDVRLDHETR